MALIGGNVGLFMLRERKSGTLWISDKISLDDPVYLPTLVSFITLAFDDVVCRDEELELLCRMGQLPSAYRYNYDGPVEVSKALYNVSIGQYLPQEIQRVRMFVSHL